MRENKLIKITENIKKDFAKLSKAKDLELDLFEILQNLSDEELRIVSGGTKFIKNKISAGILGGFYYRFVAKNPQPCCVLKTL